MELIEPLKLISFVFRVAVVVEVDVTVRNHDITDILEATQKMMKGIIPGSTARDNPLQYSINLFCILFPIYLKLESER